MSKTWVKALVLAGPILLFPVSRSYYIFYVAILIWGWAENGVVTLWRENRAISNAFYAFALPVAATFLAWLFRGELHAEWIGKIGVFLLAALLAMGAAQLSRDKRITSMACGIISIAVMSWVADGLVQLLLGHSINCRTEVSACVTDPRISLYFSAKTKLSYYMGMLILLPVAWLLHQKRTMLAVLALLLAGPVVMAAGSRFGMLSYLMSCGVLLLYATTSFHLYVRLALLIGAPLLVGCFAVVFYHLNHAFHARMDVTAGVFKSLDYKTVDAALSGRLDIWVPTLHMVKDHWLFGAGPGNLDAAVRPYLQEGNRFTHIKIFHAHQVLLDTLAATGIIGLLSFLTYYFWILKRFIRAGINGINLRWAGLLVFLLMWFPLNSAQGFYSSELVFLTFYMLGLGFGFGYREAHNDGQPVPV